jgi:hypothetical protein
MAFAAFAPGNDDQIPTTNVDSAVRFSTAINAA